MTNPVRILIVENNEKAAGELRSRLERLGYLVLGVAGSGEEAVSRTRELNPDLLLMNIKLKDVRDGIHTGRLIHADHKKPIIYITSSASQATIQRAGSAGSFGYLFPAMDDRQLYATIETAVSRNTLEIKLESSRHWLNSILNSVGDGVIALDTDGRIQFINFVAQQLTGWTQADASNKWIYDVCQFIDEKTHAVIDLARFGYEADTPYHLSRKTALLVSTEPKSIPVDLNLSLVKTREGEIKGIVMAFRDISEHRNDLRKIGLQAHRAGILESSASKLSSILDAKMALEAISEIVNHALHSSATAAVLYSDFDTLPEVAFLSAGKTDAYDAVKVNNISLSRETVEGLVSEAAPVLVVSTPEEIGVHPGLASLIPGSTKSLILGGMFRQEQLIGAVVSFDPDHLRPHDEAEIQMLSGLLNQGATALTNALLFRQIKMGRERHRRVAKSLVDIQEKERRRIARELHDHLGQLLTGLQFMLESAKTRPYDAFKPAIDDIQKAVREIIEQVREMSLNLRPGMLDDVGLTPTLRWHFDRYEKQTGVHVAYTFDGISESLPQELETAAYRILQEALTNVARYANVKAVDVTLAIREESLWVEVADKGPGFDLSRITEKPSSGLGGMRERAELAGGYLLVYSTPSQGTQIIAVLPIGEERLERRKNVR